MGSKPNCLVIYGVWDMELTWNEFFGLWVFEKACFHGRDVITINFIEVTLINTKVMVVVTF